MSKYTYKQIKQIQEWTPVELKGKQINTIKKHLQVGYFMKSTANWSYQVYVIEYKGFLREVVVVFGSIA